MRAILKPLRRRTGLIHYIHNDTREVWGTDAWTMTRGEDDLRVLVSHCEMALNDDWVVRDSTQSVHPDFHPNEASVRIMNQGRLTGTGWFHFTDTVASCESFTVAEGRISQRFDIQRPIRGFGVHALQSDGWLAATFPYEKGVGHVQFFGKNLMHSLHHLGATGPFLATTGSGLEYAGVEEVTVAAGSFECHHVMFRGLTNNHPPYHMWISTCGDYLYVKGTVEGYMDSSFELVELDGVPLI